MQHLANGRLCAGANLVDSKLCALSRIRHPGGDGLSKDDRGEEGTNTARARGHFHRSWTRQDRMRASHGAILSDLLLLLLAGIL